MAKVKYNLVDVMLFVAIVRCSAFVLLACIQALSGVIRSGPPFGFFLAAIFQLGLTVILLPESYLMPESYLLRPQMQPFSPLQAVGFSFVAGGSAVWVFLAYLANRLSRYVRPR